MRCICPFSRKLNLLNDLKNLCYIYDQSTASKSVGRIWRAEKRITTQSDKNQELQTLQSQFWISE